MWGEEDTGELMSGVDVQDASPAAGGAAVSGMHGPLSGRADADWFSRDPLEARFLDKVYPDPLTGCWIWGGAVSKNGYGAFSYAGRVIGAHQMAFLLYHGPLRPKDVPGHRCDFPLCVNPDHLFRASQLTNNRDRSRKNRSARLWGQRNPAAKLSDREREEVRRLLTSGRVTQEQVAQLYGVSQTTISAVWRHA